MIYGNPLIFGGSGGGGGPSASDAILTVTVPTGSTVTATKGGTTLTPTMWVQAADATLDCALFVIPAAQFDATTPWTVTATLRTDSATATVLIDSNNQYDLELSYHYYLYNKGIQFPNRLGGGLDASSASSSVFLSDRIHLFGGEFPCLSTVNKLSFRGWSKVAFRIINANLDTAEGLIFYAGSQKYSSTSGTFFNLIKITDNGTFYMDVSNLQSSTYYIEGYVYTNNKYADVEQIWLE